MADHFGKLAGIAALSLILAACDMGAQKGEVYEVDAPPVEAVVIADSDEAPEADAVVAAASTANIDWEKARTDFAARPVDADTGAVQIESGGPAVAVPVLLPEGIVTPAGEENAPRFQPLSDGYFAAYPGIEYDIIVNGTNQVIGAGDAAVAPDRPPTYQIASAGAQVSLSRYGADYLVEFECNEISGADGTCISEEDAMEIAQGLVIVGTQ